MLGFHFQLQRGEESREEKREGEKKREKQKRRKKMEVVRGRRSRDMMSPPPVRVNNPNVNAYTQGRMMRPTFKRVQVVYYLSRNGQLEHPHFMEVTHLANQNLRLKDVLDRLTVLRGKGMPSLYSWSCKRCYKNGYVWNDLSENDVIYPSEGGAEYILKGSEVIEGCTAEKFQQFQLGNTQQRMQSTKIQPKLKSPRVTKRQPELPVVGNNNRYADGVEDEEEEEYYEEKVSYTVTPRSRCSRGISTDEVEKPKQQQKCQENLKSPMSELTLDGSPPPPSTTSSNLSDKSNNNNASKRYEDGEAVIGTEVPLVVSRNSMLLQLIACGSSLPFKSKNNNNHVSVVNKQQPPAAMSSRKSNCSDLHKGVLCKNAAVMVEEEEVVVVEDEMIKCMSENPRFGNLQAEEKEYFSGSIVEAMSTEERAHITPSLKKSTSYNEERSSKPIILVEEEEAVEEEEEEVEEEYKRREKCMNGKCIPRKRCSTKQSKK